MTDLVQKLVGALEELLHECEQGIATSPHARIEARSALTAAKAGGWVAVPDCPDGDVWFALSCGHVVIGYKTGDMLDWEAMIDHDCCSDAHAVKAQPVATPTPPKDPA